MLEQNDLELIGKIVRREIREELGERFAEQDERIDKRFAEQDERMDRMEKCFAEQNERMDRMEKRFAEQDEHFEMRLKEQESSLKQYIRNELTHTENLLLEEIERQRRITDERFDRLENEMQTIRSYSRINQLDLERMTLLEDKVVRISDRTDELDERVRVLEGQCTGTM